MLPIFAKAPCCLELFGCCLRRLSQHGVGEVLIPLRHCWRDAFFCVCVGSGSFCHDWASHCSVLFWSFDALFVFGLPPLRPPRVVTHATRRRALCTLAGTWEQSRTKILRKPQKFQSSSSYCKLHSRRKTSNTSKISNALSARLQKCQNSILRTLAFLRNLLE